MAPIESVGCWSVSGRQVFGSGYGLAIESGPRSGTTVRLRVPKYRPGVRAS